MIPTIELLRKVFVKFILTIFSIFLFPIIYNSNNVFYCSIVAHEYEFQLLF